jgi:hypothetical protein
MLFQFESRATYSFYMWRTEIALDVLFFDERGRHVGDARMEPCPHEAPDRCPRYLPDVPFLTALEVPAGALDEHRVDSDWSIGIEPPATDRPVPDRA